MSEPRWQFCWYGLRGPWLRLRLDRFEGGLSRIYAYRFGVGPLDIRRWRDRETPGSGQRPSVEGQA